MPTIKFLVEHLNLDVPAERTVRQVAVEAGIDLNREFFRGFNCGGRGLCGTCRVWIRELSPNATSKPNLREKFYGMGDGRRLACQTRVLGDIEVTSMPGGDDRFDTNRTIDPPPQRAREPEPKVAAKKTEDKKADKAEDKKAEDKKAEDKKAEDKKAEDKKAEDKKAEDKKAEDKKAEDKKAEDKKAEDKKAEDKKAEDKKAEDKKAEDKKAEDKKAEEIDQEKSEDKKADDSNDK